MIVDISRRGLTSLSKSDIPRDACDVDASYNLLTSLPVDVFAERPRIWNINLRGNKISRLDFLRDMTSLGVLDLGENRLTLDSLTDVFHMHIMHLKLDGNESLSGLTEPLFLPAVFPHAWIINGSFMTDFTRRVAAQFRDSLQFAEQALALRKYNTKKGDYVSPSNAAERFLAGTTFRKKESSLVSANGVLLMSNDNEMQISRLEFLLNHFQVSLPPGDFTDYFGLAAGLLSFFWLNSPVDLIPRIVCGNYWLSVIKDIEKMEQFQLLLLLKKISDVIKPENDVQAALWEKINLQNFIETGKIPILGHSSRLILQAFIERSPDLSTTADRILYLKLRNSAKFEDMSADLNTIYNEIIAPLPEVAREHPEKGDNLVLRHPFGDIWADGTVVSYQNGRVITKLEDFVVHLPILSVFWDGRSGWREAMPMIDPLPNEEESDDELEDKTETPGGTRIHKTTPIDIGNHRTIHVRSKSEIKQVEHDKSYKIGIFDPTATLRKASPFSHHCSRYGNRTSMSTGFSSTFNYSSPSQSVTPTFVTDGFFQRNELPTAYIHMPQKPFRRPVVRAPPRRAPNLYIQDVVNITFGVEIGGGKRLRKFNVRMENPLTKKAQYKWISEDEIPPADARRLTELFQKHIESKMTIIPGI